MIVVGGDTLTGSVTGAAGVITAVADGAAIEVSETNFGDVERDQMALAKVRTASTPNLAQERLRPIVRTTQGYVRPSAGTQRQDNVVGRIVFSLADVRLAGVVEDHDGRDDGAKPRRGRKRCARGAEGDPRALFWGGGRGRGECVDHRPLPIEP